MIHPIVKYGDPVLETPAKHVEKFDEGLQKLVADMFESMYAANGVGLAAVSYTHLASWALIVTYKGRTT